MSSGETRGGNYTAFVSVGAFNDLSTLRRVFSSPSGSRSLTRIRCSRVQAAKKPRATKRAGSIESNRSNRIRDSDPRRGGTQVESRLRLDTRRSEREIHDEREGGGGEEEKRSDENG